jgi:hypothetical protein
MNTGFYPFLLSVAFLSFRPTFTPTVENDRENNPGRIQFAALIGTRFWSFKPTAAVDGARRKP